MEAEVKCQLIIVSLTRSSAVAKKLRDVPCRWNVCCHADTKGHSNLHGWV